MSVRSEEQGAIAYAWWKQHISRRDEAGQRGLSARLRRADIIKILCEPAVHELYRDLRMKPSQSYDLARLATLLAELRSNDRQTLAQVLGGEKPILSRSRFEHLIRAKGDDLTDGLRNAIHMLKPERRVCNVAVFAADLMNWEAARRRWCFEYFDPDTPAPTNDDRRLQDSEETSE